MKIGQKVTILADVFHLRHRKIRSGKITNIDGAYILVRPSWCSWEIELYPNEVELI